MQKPLYVPEKQVTTRIAPTLLYMAEKWVRVIISLFLESQIHYIFTSNVKANIAEHSPQ